MKSMDCEWRANRAKGSKPNKVSLMQFPFDNLLKIFEDSGVVTNGRFKHMVHPHSIWVMWQIPSCMHGRPWTTAACWMQLYGQWSSFN